MSGYLTDKNIREDPAALVELQRLGYRATPVTIIGHACVSGGPGRLRAGLPAVDAPTLAGLYHVRAGLRGRSCPGLFHGDGREAAGPRRRGRPSLSQPAPDAREAGCSGP